MNSGNRSQTLSQFYHNRAKTEGRLELESGRKLLKKLVPEVGIEPTWGEAPRDFETIQPQLCLSLKLNNSYHLQTLMSSLKFPESWLLLAFCDVIFFPWAQFRHSLRVPFRHEKPLMGLFEVMWVYLTGRVGAIKKSGTIRAQSEHSHSLILRQLVDTRIRFSALLESHGRSALNSRWLHSLDSFLIHPHQCRDMDVHIIINLTTRLLS